MECFIVNESDIVLESFVFDLKRDEARHAVRVLRMRSGEPLMVTTLKGCCYRAILSDTEQIAKNEWIVHCKIQEILPEFNEPHLDIQLVQGILQQQSKFEEIIEKSTEIGVRSIVPLTSKRCEKKTVNRERLQRILTTACKQSSRARVPYLAEVMGLEDSLIQAGVADRKIILLHESADPEETLLKSLTTYHGSKIALFVGPEGGFEQDEVLLAGSKYGAMVASLGSRRLRAETAAIMAVSITMGSEY